MPEAYDAVLVMSFGGPEEYADVMPFLENVVRGRNVPRERLLEVARHYYEYGGRSPINAQNRELIAALRVELERHGPRLPVYWGNRNWKPYLADAIRDMRNAGVRRAIAFVTSAFGSYSGCRQYLEDFARARAEAGPDAPVIDKLRSFYNHPGFIETVTVRVADAFAHMDGTRRKAAGMIYTAHSVPMEMAQSSPYARQIEESCRLVSEASGLAEWTVAYQSRSGPPSTPWLGPDILDAIRERHAAGVREIVVAPIGFISDHMEVEYDLDIEAKAFAEGLGVHLVRARTAGSHPRFIRMVRELIQERVAGSPASVIGGQPPGPDACPPECCPAPARPSHPAFAAAPLATPPVPHTR